MAKVEFPKRLNRQNPLSYEKQATGQTNLHKARREARRITTFKDTLGTPAITKKLKARDLGEDSPRITGRNRPRHDFMSLGKTARDCLLHQKTVRPRPARYVLFR